MKVGARLVAELEDGMLDIAAPSIEPLAGFFNKMLRGWPINDMIDRDIKEPNTHFVDVGACIGSWGLIMASRYPWSVVTCIEPYPKNYECLKYNARPFRNVKTINAAASGKEGAIRLSLPDINVFKEHRPIELWHNYGLITAYGEPDRMPEEVQAYPLDDLVMNVGVLKIDVEGMELEVLAGARRILSKERPLLQIEFMKRNQERAGHTLEELNAAIEAYDYVIIAEVETDLIYMAKEKL